jgi:hypothetical protein
VGAWPAPQNQKHNSHHSGGFFYFWRKHVKNENAGRKTQTITKEDILKAIRETARKLGHTPQLAELARMGVLERMHVRRHFRSYTLAVRECGLDPQVSVTTAPIKALFTEWAKVARKRKRLPVLSDFPATGKISRNVFLYRFGGWRRVPEAMAQYAREQNLRERWQDVMEMIEERKNEGMALRAVTRPAKLKHLVQKYLSPVYGAAITRGPMVNEPINEQGVLFLFGAMCEKLGFKVTLVQTGFPDVEALIEVSPGRWKRVRIEVEYESRNFTKHKHHAKGCDMIVCWIHNWKECPLEVIELSKLVG